MRTVVVVGAGIAGTTAAATLRQQGYDGRLVLAGAEPVAPYRRPALSKEVLRGAKDVTEVAVKPAGWYDAQDIELLTGTTVSELDVPGRTVTVDGARLGWDAAVLATGGRPRLLPGTPAGVHTLRTAADVPALRAALRPGARVVVVGAGFLGAEVAATARTLDCAVTLLEAAPVPLGRLLPPVVAEVYARLHRDRGVDLRLGVGVARVEAHRVVGTDGTEWPADAVVVAVGMDAEVALAEQAGLAVDGGIVTDAHGRTSAPGVWAAGDVAAFPDPVTGLPRRTEHWQSAVSQGAVVARNLLGAGAPLDEVPWCWSDQYGVNLQVCGSPRSDDAVRIRGSLDAGSFTAVFARDGVLSGAIGVDRPGDIRVLRKLLATAPETPLDLVADEGTELAGLAAPARSA
ncbi:MAG TPA: FAD-dependent oxidoreductase [Mycobacteriales bacterium]|nr:FAD-dependent oxidoreductase [Mycobacteriales bacterium]